jgi:CRISPR system Cascade subunit CasA
VPVVRTVKSRPDGTSYEGAFRHPLTPYKQIKPDEPWAAKRGSPEGLPYRDWPQIVTGATERAPATVVSYLATSDRRDRLSQRRLAAFGYATDNMKPLRWCEATTPLLIAPPSRAEQFSVEAQQLVNASEEVRKTLAYQVKAAWSDRPKDLPGDAHARINAAFWSHTEPAFFVAVRALCDAPNRAAGDIAREAWLTALHQAALDLFDSFAATTVDLATGDLGRVVLARRNLSRFVSPQATKLREALGLHVAETATAPKKKAKARTKKETA